MFERLQTLNAENTPLVYATVVTSAKQNVHVGMKMIFAATGERIGTLGDATLEAAVEEETAGSLKTTERAYFVRTTRLQSS